MKLKLGQLVQIKHDGEVAENLRGLVAMVVDDRATASIVQYRSDEGSLEKQILNNSNLDIITH